MNIVNKKIMWKCKRLLTGLNKQNCETSIIQLNLEFIVENRIQIEILVYMVKQITSSLILKVWELLAALNGQGLPKKPGKASNPVSIYAA